MGSSGQCTDPASWQRASCAPVGWRSHAILLESCVALGSEALARLPGLLVPFIDGHICAGDDVPSEPVPAFAALALLLSAAKVDPGDVRLEAVAARLLELEAQLANADCYPHAGNGFVLGTTYFDQRMDIWQDQVRETLSCLQVPQGLPALARVVRQLLNGDRPQS
jgi:hypothetical protein